MPFDAAILLLMDNTLSFIAVATPLALFISDYAAAPCYTPPPPARVQQKANHQNNTLLSLYRFDADA